MNDVLHITLTSLNCFEQTLKTRYPEHNLGTDVRILKDCLVISIIDICFIVMMWCKN